MEKELQLPTIPEDEQTPVVKVLLGIIEKLAVTVQRQEEQIQQLKDEVAILKGEKKRPKFKPSKLDPKTDQDDIAPTDKAGKRPGSKKRSKTAELMIHEEQIIPPRAQIPPGSRFKGYREVVVQDLVIRAHNVRYRLERWTTPDGQPLVGQLPESSGDGHYGPTLTSYILYQHHQCQVTQPLLREQLREWGIDISSGQINRVLLADKARFHDEKDALLTTGLAVSSYVTVDDTGARHQGQNGCVTHIGNEFFAWFCATSSKSRINFLELLRADHRDYQLNDQALVYMAHQKLPKAPLEHLRHHRGQRFADKTHWEAHLERLGISRDRHRRIATEGALLGSLVARGLSPELAIISDDAGQFNVLLHGLCWVHAERLVHKLIPLNEAHRQDMASVREQIWSFYADLKAYKKTPTAESKEALRTRFDAIFTQRTRFETLNQTLKRISHNKAELLLVLERPDVPLHTNGSERDIRDYVKKNKVSGGTRSDLGRRCRDTFTSLKKTCRKLGVSFWDYLTDRVSSAHQLPPLAELVEAKAAPISE